MTDSFDALPPYPGVPFSPTTTPGAPPAGPPSEPPPAPSRRWLAPTLGAGAVLLAAGAFFLGRGTAHRPTETLPATALSAATSPAGSAGCAVTTRRVAVGTLKSNSAGTLTVTPPKGGDVTVKTDSSTKVTRVVKAALSDVTVGAVVAVHGTAGATSTIAADQIAILPAAPAPASRPGFGPAAGAFGPRGVAPGAGAAKGGGRLTVGTVKSVSGSTITLTSGTTTTTVTTSSSTAYLKTVTGGVGDLAIGKPVAVTGTPNSDGSITAATIEQGDTSASGGVLAPFAPFAPFGPAGGFGGGGFGHVRGSFPGGGPGPGTTLPPATTPTTTG